MATSKGVIRRSLNGSEGRPPLGLTTEGALPGGEGRVASLVVEAFRSGADFALVGLLLVEPLDARLAEDPDGASFDLSSLSSGSSSSSPSDCRL